MNYKEQIIQEIEQILELLLGEVIDFIQFLKQKYPFPETSKTAILSQSSLQKDWLTTEEDEAWQLL